MNISVSCVLRHKLSVRQTNPKLLCVKSPQNCCAANHPKIVVPQITPKLLCVKSPQNCCAANYPKIVVVESP